MCANCSMESTLPCRRITLWQYSMLFVLNQTFKVYPEFDNNSAVIVSRVNHTDYRQNSSEIPENCSHHFLVCQCLSKFLEFATRMSEHPQWSQYSQSTSMPHLQSQFPQKIHSLLPCTTEETSKLNFSSSFVNTSKLFRYPLCAKLVVAKLSVKIPGFLKTYEKSSEIMKWCRAYRIWSTCWMSSLETIENCPWPFVIHIHKTDFEFS